VESFSGADLLGVRGFGVSDAFVELRNDRFEGVAGNLAELSGSEEVSEGTEAIDSVLLRFLLVPFVPFVLPVSTDALVDFLASTSSPSELDSLKSKMSLDRFCRFAGGDGLLCFLCRFRGIVSCISFS